MKLEIDREPLVEALSRLAPIASTSKVMPILSNVYLRAGNAEQNDYLALDATDLETWMKIKLMSCRVVEPGGVCLDGKKIFDIAKAMTDDQIAIVTDDKNRAAITSGPSSFNLNGLSGQDFPQWIEDESSQTISVPKLTLLNAINQTMFAASSDDSRFNLGAVMWEVADGSMKFVATDGHRMAITSEVSLVLADDMKLMVPKKSMMAIKKFIDKTNNPVQIDVCKKHIIINADNATLGCRLIDGEYPDYNKVIPSSAGQVATVDRVGLSRSLSMVRLMTSDRNRGVVLSLGDNTITISAKHPDMGEAQDSMPIDYNGPQIELIANVEYLIEGLNVIETDNILLEYFKEGSPIMFRPVGVGNYFNLVMPMRK